MIIIYNLFIAVSILAGLPFLIFLLAPHKRRSTFSRRLWLSPRRHEIVSRSPDQAKAVKPIWVHALSLGEVLSSEPIINRMLVEFPHIPIVYSSSTKTGYSAAKTKFAANVDTIVYFPYDFPFSVINALRFVNPRLVVLVETDIWPNFLYSLKRKNIPTLLANTRLSDRSYRNYRKAGGLTRWLYSMIDRFGVQSPQDAWRFRQLGTPVERITLTGNVKFDQCDTSEVSDSQQHIRRNLGLADDALVIVAGSTHSGEEETICDAFLEIRNLFPQLIMIIAPRDPGRAASVAALCSERGLPSSFLNSLDRPNPDDTNPIRIVDTIGILRRLYAAADIALIGGSLIPFGGHNPLEPAAFAKPIVFGPHMHDFRAISELLIQGNGAVQLEKVADLTTTISELLKNDVMRSAIGKRAHELLSANQGATERTISIIRSLIKPLTADRK